jgi:hypothetical protein
MGLGICLYPGGKYLGNIFAVKADLSRLFNRGRSMMEMDETGSFVNESKRSQR